MAISDDWTCSSAYCLTNCDAPARSSQPSLGRFISQGATAGIIAGFLYPVVLMLTVRSPYNFLFIGALPFFLFFGVLVGIFKSFVVWAYTKLFRRRLGVISRVAIAELMIGFFIACLWWPWFSRSPLRSSYYSGISSSAVASLEGVRVIRLGGIAVSSSTVGDKAERITEAQLRNLVIYKLMDAGIDVVNEDSDAAVQATLYVNYSYSNEFKQPDFYTSNCHLRLTQDVVLRRDPQITTESPTWEYENGSISAGLPLNSHINEAVEHFVRDYNRANFHAADAQTSSEGPSEVSTLIWLSVCLIINAIVIGMIVGSGVQPWRTLAYGIGGPFISPTIAAVIIGIILRMMVVFVFMESILMLISILQSNSQHRDIHLVLLAIGHCLLGGIAVFGRFKFITVTVISLIAIVPVLLLFTVQQNMHWVVNCVVLGYVSLWMTFLLTRSSLVHSAFSNIKEELRYYLIE